MPGPYRIFAADRPETSNAVSDQIAHQLWKHLAGSMRRQTRLWQYYAVATVASAAVSGVRLAATPLM